MRKWALILFLLVFLTVSAYIAYLPHAQAAPVGPALAEVLPTEAPIDLPLLVNNDNSLPEGFKPEKLVKMYDHKRSFKLSESDIRVSASVFEAMNAMFKAAKDDGVTGFIVTSGYRTQKEQTRIYKSDKKGIAAVPGYSEHQTGLAFDVTAYGDPDFAKTKQYKWLKAHCWEHGFIIRYPKGKEDITGIPYEPWHYRYVGVEHAMAIKELGYITLEEYNAAGGAAGFPALGAAEGGAE